MMGDQGKSKGITLFYFFLISSVWITVCIHYENVFRPFCISNGHWEVGMSVNEYFINWR